MASGDRNACHRKNIRIAKGILRAIMNVPHSADPNQLTDLWLSELTHALKWALLPVEAYL